MIWAIIILALVVVFLLYNHLKKKDLFEKVEWCVSSDSLFRMLEQILYVQDRLCLEEKYRVAIDEWDAIRDILQSYQKYLIQKYFNDSLPNYGWTKDICFVITLGDFLEEHQYEKNFNGNDMYISQTSNASYELTDYAVAYQKVYYIAQLYYLKLYKICGRNTIGVIRAEETRKTIENREIAADRL